MERVNLQEGWRFAKANSNEWTPVSVPGTVLSGLLEAGKMQDPYYRENEYKARELLAKDYVFETDFCISEDLLQPQIETSVTEKDGTIEIQISADCFAPFVWLEIEDDVIFSDNCFDLTSEETKTICIRKEDVLSGKVLSADNVRKTLKIRSLRDTYEQ